MDIPVTPFTVFVLAALTAVATGLGALPLAVVGRVSRRWLGLANGAAAGLMIAASLGLLYEGVRFGPSATVVGAAVGVVLIRTVHGWLERRETVEIGRMRGLDARKVLMLVGVMTAHSLAEGVGVGVSFGGGDELGLVVTAAIALHNVPEGLAIALVAVPRGMSVAAAVGWSVVSSLPQPIMAVPAYLFVETFAPFLPAGFGFAADAMLWMAAADLLPDAVADARPGPVAMAVLLALAAMGALQVWVGG